MTHFAEIDENNIVIRVLSIESDEVGSGKWGNPENWIQTSYNTRLGVHILGGTPLRKNFAGKGFKYDLDLDAFIDKKPHNSWILNEITCAYECPIPQPSIEEGQACFWNESELKWDIFE